jgi:hypothetical protein
MLIREVLRRYVLFTTLAMGMHLLPNLPLYQCLKLLYPCGVSGISFTTN